MTRWSKRGRGLALGLAVLLMLAACGSDDGGDGDDDGGGPEESLDETPAAERSRPLQRAGPEPEQGFDPQVAVQDASRNRMGLMYSKLVEYDQDAEVVGALAESWEQSEDGLLWTFHLRDTARFSDGSPVNASDVLFSLNYVRDSEAAGGAFPDIAEIRAVDDQTVEIELAAPAGRQLLLALLREGTAGIISEAAVEAAGGPEDYFTMPTTTSGPFVLDEFVPSSHMTFVANDHFWREGYPKSDGIEFTFQTDTQAVLAGLRTGSYDFIRLPHENAEEFRASDEFDMYEADGQSPTFWGLNREGPPFDSQQVRQAFAYAVDREGPREACWFGTGAVTYGNLLRPWTPSYVEIDTYDLPREQAYERAGELLDAAGWVDDGSGTRVAQGVDGVEDGTPLSVTVPYEGNWPAAECNTLILQQTMAEVGVEIVPESYDPAAFWGDVAEGEFTMWHGGAGSENEESFFANWFKSDGLLTPLTTRLDDERIDEQVTEALTTPDLDRATRIFQELEEWQVDYVPLIAIGYQHTVIAANKNLRDFWTARYAGNRPESESWVDE